VTDSPERQVDQAMERDGTAAVSPVRVAAVHFDMQVGTENRQRNIKHGLDLARRAVDDGCTLIVLPETGEHRLHVHQSAGSVRPRRTRARR